MKCNTLQNKLASKIMALKKRMLTLKMLLLNTKQKNHVIRIMHKIQMLICYMSSVYYCQFQWNITARVGTVLLSTSVMKCFGQTKCTATTSLNLLNWIITLFG